MNILNETIIWHKGEIFEAICISLFGIILLALAAFIWKFGETPNTTALKIPLLILGLLFAMNGGVMARSNSKKIAKITRTERATIEFISQEKQRVEDFMHLYHYTKIGALISFGIAMALFFLTDNKFAHAIAISLIILGGTGLVIDYFSKERAEIYYHKLYHSNA